MADVSLDLQNSNPKELYGQGIRAFVLQDYDTAVKAFSKTSELLVAENGSEIHDSLGDVYLYYGKSLLELSRKESGPLGEGVLKNVEEESEEEEIEEEEEEKANGEISKEEADSTENKKVDSAGIKEANSTENKDEAESVDKKEENNGESESTDKKEDDELTDLQVAWEVLELAKRIFTARGDDGKKNLAETLINLGEISLESGNFASAIEDMLEGLKIQKELFGNDSRTIAETYYKLGGAYSINAQIDEAISSFNSSLEYLQNKITNLKKEEEQNAEEIKELDALIPEIQEKIVDMKNLKVEIAKKVTAPSDETAPKANGTEASSSKQVNDISHLVKRKRKDEEPSQEENPAKKPSP